MCYTCGWEFTSNPNSLKVSRSSRIVRSASGRRVECKIVVFSSSRKEELWFPIRRLRVSEWSTLRFASSLQWFLRHPDASLLLAIEEKNSPIMATLTSEIEGLVSLIECFTSFSSIARRRRLSRNWARYSTLEGGTVVRHEYTVFRTCLY